MLRRVTYLASLALTMLGTWFIAGGVGEAALQEAGRDVDLAAVGAEGAPDAEGVDAPTLRPITRDELLGANLFDLPAPPAASAPMTPSATFALAERSAPVRQGPPAACTLPWRVVALVAFAPRQQDLSLAAVESGSVVREVRVGDHLDDAVVTRIGSNRLFLRRVGEPSECFVDIRRPPGPEPPPGEPERAERTEEPPARRPAPPPIDGASERFRRAVEASVRPLSDTEFEIDRSLIRTVTDDPSLAMDALRVTPAEEQGAPIGFRVFGVRPGSLAEKLGLRTGDVVRVINGLPMNSMDNVMRAYGLLRMADEISVETTRRGERRTLVYRIR